MRRHLLLPLILAASACGAPDATKDDTDAVGADTDVVIDTTTGDDTDVVAGGDTDDTVVEDTDVIVPFDPIGAWTLSNGVVSTYSGCQSQPQMLSDTSVTWSEPYAPDVQLLMSAFSDAFNCTRSGNTLSCTTQNYRSNYTGYYVIYSAGLSMTLGATDGTATVTRTDTRVCTETTGTCSGNAECSGVFVWTATKP